jgi:hypothetical protein
MLSLRISPEQTRAIDEISARQNLSRSEWLRQLIDRTVSEQTQSPHDYYLELMRDIDMSKIPTRDAQWGTRAADHSQVLKHKLRQKMATEVSQ